MCWLLVAPLDDVARVGRVPGLRLAAVPLLLGRPLARSLVVRGRLVGVGAIALLLVGGAGEGRPHAVAGGVEHDVDLGEQAPRLLEGDPVLLLHLGVVPALPVGGELVELGGPAVGHLLGRDRVVAIDRELAVVVDVFVGHVGHSLVELGPAPGELLQCELVRCGPVIAQELERPVGGSPGPEGLGGVVLDGVVGPRHGVPPSCCSSGPKD